MKRPLTQRQKRGLLAMMNGGSVMRENLDTITGASNSPDVIAKLRGMGLEIPCERVERFDRDGNSCYPGRYSLTTEDRVLARQLLGGGS